MPQPRHDSDAPATVPQPGDHEDLDPGWRGYLRLAFGLVGREGWITLGIMAAAWIVTASIGVTALVLAGGDR